MKERKITNKKSLLKEEIKVVNKKSKNFIKSCSPIFSFNFIRNFFQILKWKKSRKEWTDEASIYFLQDYPLPLLEKKWSQK